jgi:hypothetical protein
MVQINNTKIADIGFYINLDKRTDRNETLQKHLEEFEITGVERFSARSDNSAGQLNLINTTFDIYEKFLETDAETLLILEDDCKFLPILKEHSHNIFNDIYSCDWDLFWLGCVNRRSPIKYKNNCYQVSSTSYAQSYIIKRRMCQDILTHFKNNWAHLGVDELLTLFAYGVDLAKNPNKYSFYQSDQPLNDFKTEYLCLCHTYALSTQYNSYSDLWKHVTTLENWIPKHHPNEKPSWLN